ncbi:MAG: hypothetical protein Q7S72_00140 [Candidatus Taylorbacteria bacterium]|nr:hypothetical protein [Candidatus Taylorbacteria bacterium]
MKKTNKINCDLCYICDMNPTIDDITPYCYACMAEGVKLDAMNKLWNNIKGLLARIQI